MKGQFLVRTREVEFLREDLPAGAAEAVATSRPTATTTTTTITRPGAVPEAVFPNPLGWAEPADATSPLSAATPWSAVALDLPDHVSKSLDHLIKLGLNDSISISIVRARYLPPPAGRWRLKEAPNPAPAARANAGSGAGYMMEKRR